MKYKKILSVGDPLFYKVKKRVIIKCDNCPQDPLHDWDQIFLFHSFITRDFCGNESDKGYESPFVEIEDEDGFGTGEFKFRDGVIAFPVSAYIHGAIAFSLGDGSHFPDQMWDVTRRAAYLWTDKKRFEKMCAKDGWMTVYDKKLGKRRPAKDEDEFREYLRTLAESELKTIQTCMDGNVYGYVTEKRSEFKKVYPDGREEDCFEYEDTTDSCWGFIQDQDSKYFYLDAEKSYDDSVEWFTDEDYLVGDEYEVPEFVVTMVAPKEAPVPSETRFYLSAYGSEQAWTCDKSRALKFSSWWEVQSVAQKVVPEGKYEPYENCVEIDKIDEHGNIKEEIS